MRLKIVYFFLLICFFLTQSVHSQTPPNEINLADKYFTQKEYSKAKTIYTKLLTKEPKIGKNALLKLAFIYENEKDYTRALYYLNLYFELDPTERVITKMNSIAIENNLEGYELSDFYLILLLLKQYSFVLILLFALLGLYVATIFIIKKIKKQSISAKQKLVLFLYLAFVFCILNISKLYRQGIIHQANASLRIDPSSASPVYEVLAAGQRINIIGSEDIWLRVFINNKFYYINRTNVWLVN